jgi:hypothetical protein
MPFTLASFAKLLLMMLQIVYEMKKRKLPDDLIQEFACFATLTIDRLDLQL